MKSHRGGCLRLGLGSGAEGPAPGLGGFRAWEPPGAPKPTGILSGSCRSILVRGIFKNWDLVPGAWNLGPGTWDLAFGA